MASSVLTSGTAVASTSGTSINFTSIPSWVKRITVMFSGVSTNGASNYLIQIGSGSISATGYAGVGSTVAGTVATTQFTTGFGFNVGAASDTLHGSMQINLLDSSTWKWTSMGILGNGNTNQIYMNGGAKNLTGVLDRLRITTVNGTDTFDAGSINIMYE